jgi:hypothetical protein
MQQPLRQMAIAADLLWSRIICVLVIAASIFNGGLKCVLFSDELPPSATRLLISLISCANWTGYASRSGKRFYQSGNRSNRSGGMGTGQNRPIANLPLAAADLLNRLRQSIHRPRQGKTCNSGAPTKPACVSRRGIPQFARQAVSGSVQAPARSADALSPPPSSGPTVPTRGLSRFRHI